MKFLKSIFNYLITRYTKVQLLIILVIVVFAFLISESNIFARIGYDAQIMELNDQIEYYRNKTTEDKQKLEQLQLDKDQIEKFVRENYLMKKDNEDVYIVE
ncbi:MAG: FtsB family cell division protein [Dysgonomonas sp.]